MPCSFRAHLSRVKPTRLARALLHTMASYEQPPQRKDFSYFRLAGSAELVLLRPARCLARHGSADLEMTIAAILRAAFHDLVSRDRH